MFIFQFLNDKIHNYIPCGPSILETCRKPAKNLFFFLVFEYMASTGTVQGFPCVVFPHREKPVFITEFPGDENSFLPDGNTTHGKTLFSLQEWTCSVKIE